MEEVLTSATSGCFKDACPLPVPTSCPLREAFFPNFPPEADRWIPSPPPPFLFMLSSAVDLASGDTNKFGHRETEF